MLNRFGLCLTLIFGLALFPPVARADPQAGGLPELASRVTILESLVTTLQTNLISLQTLVSTLQTKLTVLETAKTDLTKALSDEAAARKAADAALQSQIDAQTDVNFAMGRLIDDERKARVDADQYLGDQIDTQARTFSAPALATFLPNGDETVLAELDLPAGNYFVTGKTNVHNGDHSAGWICALYLNGPTELDGVLYYTVPPSGLGINTPAGELVMHQVVTLSAPGHVTLQCNSGEPGSDVSAIRLIAIRVGRVN